MPRHLGELASAAWFEFSSKRKRQKSPRSANAALRKLDLAIIHLRLKNNWTNRQAKDYLHKSDAILTSYSKQDFIHFIVNMDLS